MRLAKRSGFTIVELLVVIGIIGVLMALLFPAVQAAREAARCMTCKSHLRQLGLAMQHHYEAYNKFPSGGWGYLWVGDPDRGTGRDQPGSWAYNILPYLEQSPLRKLGKGQTDDEKMALAPSVAEQPLPMFNCPSRREVKLYPYLDKNPLRNSAEPTRGVKSDYAINGGDKPCGQPGPRNFEEGDSGLYDWGEIAKATGIAYVRSEVAIKDVIDGTSHTYMIGEKYCQKAGYDQGDDQHLYVGHDIDSLRYTMLKWPPLRDANRRQARRFGSAHSDVCHFVFADGSVQAVGYRISPEIHRRLGNRRDGLFVELDELVP